MFVIFSIPSKIHLHFHCSLLLFSLQLSIFSCSPSSTTRIYNLVLLPLPLQTRTVSCISSRLLLARSVRQCAQDVRFSRTTHLENMSLPHAARRGHVEHSASGMLATEDHQRLMSKFAALQTHLRLNHGYRECSDSNLNGVSSVGQEV